MQRVVLVWMLFVSLMFVGCFESGGSSEASPAGAAKAQSGNKPPQVSGSPMQTVLQNTQYEFKPTATDPNGDRLTFTITQQAWLGCVRHEDRSLIRYAARVRCRRLSEHQDLGFRWPRVVIAADLRNNGYAVGVGIRDAFMDAADRK